MLLVVPYDDALVLVVDLVNPANISIFDDDDVAIGGGAMIGTDLLLLEYVFDEAAIAAVDKKVPLLALETGFKLTGS